jgi:RNA polymerase sigma-70 factor, ECF subfamily
VSPAPVGLESTLDSCRLHAATALEGPLSEVYATYFAMVWRGLRRLGVADSLLDDAAQDVFLIVHRRWAEFEGRSSLKTWIYGIVLRVAKDYRRAAARHTKRVAHIARSLADCDLGDQDGSPADAVERREANELLHALLAALDDEHREVLLLVEIEQIPVREAADALGIHIRACQRRLQAARSAFEARLATFREAEGRSTE